MELVLIKTDSPEWEFMWNWLGTHPINEGIEEPTVALHEGEAWQYMGSYQQGKRVIHSLRHRYHPRTLRTETVSVSASADFTPDQLAKNFKL